MTSGRIKSAVPPEFPGSGGKSTSAFGERFCHKWRILVAGILSLYFKAKNPHRRGKSFVIHRWQFFDDSEGHSNAITGLPGLPYCNFRKSAPGRQSPLAAYPHTNRVLSALALKKKLPFFAFNFDKSTTFRGNCQYLFLRKFVFLSLSGLRI